MFSNGLAAIKVLFFDFVPRVRASMHGCSLQVQFGNFACVHSVDTFWQLTTYLGYTPIPESCCLLHRAGGGVRGGFCHHYWMFFCSKPCGSSELVAIALTPLPSGSPRRTPSSTYQPERCRGGSRARACCYRTSETSLHGG